MASSMKSRLLEMSPDMHAAVKEVAQRKGEPASVIIRGYIRQGLEQEREHQRRLEKVAV